MYYTLRNLSDPFEGIKAHMGVPLRTVILNHVKSLSTKRMAAYLNDTCSPKVRMLILEMANLPTQDKAERSKYIDAFVERYLPSEPALKADQLEERSLLLAKYGKRPLFGGFVSEKFAASSQAGQYAKELEDLGLKVPKKIPFTYPLHRTSFVRLRSEEPSFPFRRLSWSQTDRGMHLTFFLCDEPEPFTLGIGIIERVREEEKGAEPDAEELRNWEALAGGGKVRLRREIRLPDDKIRKAMEEKELSLNLWGGVQILLIRTRKQQWLLEVGDGSISIGEIPPAVENLPVLVSDFTLLPGSFLWEEVMEAYSLALQEEMAEVQRQARLAKVRVEGGTVVGYAGGSRSGDYHYTFTCSQSLPVSQGDRILLEVTEKAAYRGVLLHKEENILHLILESRAGKHVASGYLMADEGGVLDQMNQTVRYMGERSGLGMYLLREGCRFALDSSARQGETQIRTGLEAVMEKAFSQPVTVIWGPPGTGKTYAIARLCQRALEEKLRVLVVSYANVAVDAAALQLVKILREDGEEAYLKERRVIRFGNVKDQRVTEEKEVYLSLEQQGKESDEERLLRIDRALKGSQVTFSTIAMASLDTYRSRVSADLVIFDEVSMAYVPQIFQAAALGGRHLVLVGDHRQLPPITLSKGKEVLSRDIFYCLGICDSAGEVHPHPWLVMLQEQRRMHPEIAEFSSKTFYNGLLKNHESVLPARRPIAAREPFPGCAMGMADLSDCFCVGAKSSSGSHYNLFSAMVSLAVTLACHRERTESVGVVTPYTAQVSLLQSMLQDAGRKVLTDEERTAKKEEAAPILVASAHSFQGSERDMLVFDTVESFPSSRPGPGIAATPKGNGPRLTNVALTRARGKLVTIVNSTFWFTLKEQRKGKIADLIMHLLELSQKRGLEGYLTTKNRSLPEFLLSADFAGVLAMYSAGEYLAPLLQDLQEAKEEIILFLPSGMVLEKEGLILAEEIVHARERGVRVRAKALDYERLPNIYKSFTWQTSAENSMPLLFVDKVLWYGAPLLDATLSNQYTRRVVREHLVARITGIRTLKWLREENLPAVREINGVTFPLSVKVMGEPDRAMLAMAEKSALEEEQALESYQKELQNSPGEEEEAETEEWEKEMEELLSRRRGLRKRFLQPPRLHAFVRERFTCPECRERQQKKGEPEKAVPMHLVRDSAGKAALVCGEGRHARAFTVEDAQLFLTMEEVPCPWCGEKLTPREGWRSIAFVCPQKHTCSLQTV